MTRQESIQESNVTGLFADMIADETKKGLKYAVMGAEADKDEIYRRLNTLPFFSEGYAKIHDCVFQIIEAIKDGSEVRLTEKGNIEII